MKKLNIALYGIVTTLLFNEASMAQISMPAIFSDNMVLQREMNVPVWGSAKEGSQVVVEIAGERAVAYADEKSNWTAYLPCLKAGGPYSLKVSGEQEITFSNVMVGDVWLASGQSNMNFPLLDAKDGEEDAKTANIPDIRLFYVQNELSPKPKADVNGGPWIECDSNSVREFSAVAYYFGREIYRDQKVAIGLIQNTWSGTNCEAWTSQELLNTIPVMKQRLDDFFRRNIADDSISANVRRENNNWNLATNSFEGLKKNVHTRNYSDKGWETMKIPCAINETATGDYEGIIWFRKELDLPAGFKGRDLKCSMGQVDLAGVVYFNGERICETSWNYDAYRSFIIPGRLVKSGRNLIVIRLIDSWGKGGLLGPADSMFVRIDKLEEPTQVTLAGSWKYNATLEPAFARVENFNRIPGLIFNAKIAPIIPYGIKGVIWYQGEGNAGRAYQYRTLFPLMITDWRVRWKQGYLPFLFVQLPGYSSAQYQNEYEWAELREAQLMTLSYPATGMAVTIDLGETDNLHPENKLEVGKRLAIAARKIAYNQDLVYSGPVYRSMEVAGTKVRLRFICTGSGMVTKDNMPLKGFLVAGEDRLFHRAEAYVEGDEVIVFAPEVLLPVAVRYAWANSPEGNLFNKEGLPASPFRTDSWKGVTDDKK